jgi:hypothetical protein
METDAMARLAALVLVLVAAVGFGLVDLQSTSARPPRPTAQSQPGPRPQPFQSELRRAPPALRRQLLRLLALEPPFGRRTPHPVIPRVLAGSRTCFVAGGCSLKPCRYEIYAEPAAAPVAAVVAPNRVAATCAHPAQNFRVSAQDLRVTVVSPP